MTLTKDQIIDAAMQLEPAEREVLAEELLLSIDSGERERIDAAWLEEARRRDEDFASGKTIIRPVEHVIERLESKARQ